MNSATENPATNDGEEGLPCIDCKHAAAPGEELTPERVAALLLAQEVEWHLSTGQ